MNALDHDVWVSDQFEHVPLPDRRLQKRLQLLTSRMIKSPESSIPHQQKNWKDIKGAYRFFDSDRINFNDLIQPHFDLTKKMAAQKKVILAIQDTTVISFSHHDSIEGLSDIGGPSRKKDKGIILHSALAVDPSQQYPEVIGLLDQCIYRRHNLQEKDETYVERMSRWRESMKWQETSQRIDMPNQTTKLVEVMDREADVFDVMQNCKELGHDFIIRAFQNRFIDEAEKKLFDFVKATSPSGIVEVEVKKKPGQQPRKAILDVSFSDVQMKGPKKRKGELIPCSFVYVVERDPPKGQEPLIWLLLTSLDVVSFEDACKVITWYKYRWLVEEYHKCIKTGCSVEKKQFKENVRIENFLGIANVIAVRLLQLKGFARNSPNSPAKEVIEPLKLKILLKYTETKDENITVKEYYRLVAGIGGFIGRRSDGDPGWQTLWTGELKLCMMVEGAKLALGKKCG